ncbi:hypothetical protein [uncultured Nostoc sp.]|uniref:hypothetical protein n=1 Tax=uncultured Nostoc sp. TaxID=340711 RepID=UPI0035CC6C2F
MHEGRHYKKLSPVVAIHQEALDKFLDDFWDYYRDLLIYRDFPSEQAAEKLRSEFCQLFYTNSGYQQLDERKRLTAAKIKELLRVLEHSELPLHNNPAELAARTMVQRRNISYATQTTEGTKAWDTFILKAVSLPEYIASKSFLASLKFLLFQRVLSFYKSRTQIFLV